MLRSISIAAIALAGVMHLIIGPGQFSHAFPHGVFFILIGTAQLLWALAFWRYISPILYWAGFAVSGGTISVLILTQLVSVPFALTAHVFDPLPVVVISSELVGFVTLMGLTGRGQLAAYTGRSVARMSVGAGVIAVVFGAGVWGGGQLAEVMFQGLGTSDDHHLGHEQAQGVVNRPSATPTLGPTQDLEAMIVAAVEAALKAPPTFATAPGKDSDIQGMIAAAVDAALTAPPTSASAPDEDSDIQGMIAAAVDAALTAPPTSASAPGEDSDIQDTLGAPSGSAQDSAPYVNPIDNVEPAVIATTSSPELFQIQPSADVLIMFPTAIPLPQPTASATPAATPSANPAATSPPQRSPTLVPVGAPASALSRGKASGFLLAIIGVLVVISAIGVWRTWGDG